MSIDDIFLYVGIASAIGIIAMIVPTYFHKLLNDSQGRNSKSLIR